MTDYSADLSGVQETLLLPLLARAQLSPQHSHLLADPYAVQLVSQLTGDYTGIMQAYRLVAWSWLARAYRADQYIKNYLSRYPEAVVVNLAAGLDTAFYRLDNGCLSWVDIDFPEVLAIKEKLLPTNPRLHYMPQSILDLSYLERLRSLGDKVIFLASGVFIYFTSAQVRNLLHGIARVFPQSEIMFDFIGTKSLKYANAKMQESGFSSKITWGVDGINDIKLLAPEGTEVRKIKYFSGILTQLKAPWSLKAALFLFELFDRGGIAHLHFGAHSSSKKE